jgi:tetratricopeptide (TPR) repeat protein
MRIQRNYNEPFFRARRQKHGGLRVFFILALLIAGVAGMVILQPDAVRQTALDLFGPDTTPTPLPGDLANQANELFWGGQLEQAAAMWDRVLQMRPDSIDYLYESGMLLIDLDNGRNEYADRALELAQQIILINANDPRGYALRARGLVWTGNAAAAVPVALAGLDIAPQFGPLFEALSRAYIGEGRLREGQEAGLQAIEYAPGDVRSYWAYASSLAFSGARDEAIIEYERALDVNALFWPPYFELAALYLATNRDQEAINTYDRILGVQPRNARALLRQCEAYRKIGQFERALGLCQDAVSSDPTFSDAQFRLGQILYSRREFIRAQTAFEACLQTNSGNLQCTYMLGLTYYYLAQAEYQTVCEPERLSSFECQSSSICQQGHDLIQTALTIAQSRENTQGDISIMIEGLGAIATDPACNGITGQSVLPEITPEATEASGDA